MKGRRTASPRAVIPQHDGDERRPVRRSTGTWTSPHGRLVSGATTLAVGLASIQREVPLISVRGARWR